MEKFNDSLISADIIDYSKDIDKLRFLTRYQNCPRVINENVAAHSFFVAAFILKLKDFYEFDLEKALKTALIHDMPEAFISDVPHSIKVRNKDLADALEKIEHTVLEEHLSPEAACLVDAMNEGTNAEGLACQLADILSVVLYAHDEIEVGNSKFKLIASKALIRVNQVMDKMKVFLKPNVSHEEVSAKINMIVYED